MSEKLPFNKAYVEITNVCNLDCSFCKGTDRKKEFMSADRFYAAAKKLTKVTKYIYLHVLGEPTLHPELEKILEICKDLDLKVIITTNGTLVNKVSDILLQSKALHKVNISLHAFEANSGIDFVQYLEGCFEFARKINEHGKICVLRLWNGDSERIYGQNTLNGHIIQSLKEHFAGEWTQNTKGYRIKEKLFLEFAERFNWRQEASEGKINCYGLRDQIGVLVDGTVVPCCIDCDGAISLGNIFDGEIEEIINSPLARQIAQGFRNGKAVHPYCKGCGFVRTRL
ncbi:MAG: radical SAM protein [Clostridia bacterium]|nr:radical SAM protein [Clostridia bacterium]